MKKDPLRKSRITQRVNAVEEQSDVFHNIDYFGNNMTPKDIMQRAKRIKRLPNTGTLTAYTSIGASE